MCKQRYTWSFLLLILLAFTLQGCFGIGDNTKNVGTSNGKTVSVVQNAFSGKIYATIGHNLFVITGDGQSHQLVGGGNVYDPALSPDGSKIAFVLRQKNYSDLAYIPTSGGTPTILRSGNGHYYADPADPTLIHNDFYWYQQPSWSPDGTHLLFLSDLQKNYVWAGLGAPFNNAAFEDLEVFSLDMENPDAKPHVLAYASFGDGGDRDASYVPGTDPQEIIYTHFTYDSTGTNQSVQIFLEDATAIANNPGVYTPLQDPGVALTPANAQCIQSSLSPDGHTLVFVRRDSTTQMSLVTMALATDVTADPNSQATIQKALQPYQSASVLKQGIYIGHPVWSPDSKQVAYVTESNDELDLWVTPVSLKNGTYTVTGTPVQVTKGGIDGDSRIVWTR